MGRLNIFTFVSTWSQFVLAVTERHFHKDGIAVALKTYEQLVASSQQIAPSLYLQCLLNGLSKWHDL